MKDAATRDAYGQALVEMGEDSSFTNVNGRANYEAGHIPSAEFADLMGDLSASDSPRSANRNTST